jgi:hypothetical protein
MANSYADAISGIESGGRYNLLGPVTKSGDRAYGRYQVMGSNIPDWTAKFYGQKLTPQEFLSNPQAQDAVFNGQFGQYVDKYGPEGAARAWFAGEGGMNNPNAKDILGTSVADYAAKFNAATNNPLTPGSPAPPLPPGINIDAPSVPQVASGGLLGQPQQGQQQPQVGGGLLNLASLLGGNDTASDQVPPLPQIKPVLPQVDLSRLAALLQPRQSPGWQAGPGWGALRLT